MLFVNAQQIDCAVEEGQSVSSWSGRGPQAFEFSQADQGSCISISQRSMIDKALWVRLRAQLV